MNDQFKNEPLEKQPDLNKIYHTSPHSESAGLTYLMKLVLCTKNNIESLNIIKGILGNESSDINRQNTKGWTALMIACRNSNTNSNMETIKLLLEHSDIDINKQNNEGWTALMLACRYSNTDSNMETIKLLLEHSDIDINKQNNGGWTALMMACRYSNTESNIETIKLLLENINTDINKQDNEGWTALMLACRYSNTESNIETVKLLLGHPDIDVNKQDNEGWTALMMACRNSNTESNIETVKLLLGHQDIDVNKQNNEGWTALMMACRNSNTYSSIETVKLLLEHPNIDVNKQDNDGDTALMITLKNHFQELGKKIMDIFMNTNKINFYLKNLKGQLIMDLIPVNSEFIEIIYNNRIWISNSIIKKIIAKDDINTELLIPQIFNPLNFDREIIIEILKKYKNWNKIIYYCNLHTNIKKEVLNKIQIQKEKLYYRPDNIIALCLEVNYKLKFKNPTEVFNSLNDKLKYIFDIKNEEDMINKIAFYL